MKDSETRARQILQKRDEYNEIQTVKRRKAARISVIAAVLAIAVTLPTVLVIAGRARKAPPVPEINGTESDSLTDAEVNGPESEVTYNDGVIGGTGVGPLYDGTGIASADVDRSGYGVKEIAPSAASPEGVADAPDAVEYWENDLDAKAGTLTAGEWKDLDALGQWYEKLASATWSRYVNERKISPAKIVTVTVKAGDAPCFNTEVKLISGDKTVFTAKTDVNGRAYLPCGLTGADQVEAAVVGDNVVALDGKTEIEVQAQEAGLSVTALDLMLMIDTTGSMGDELEYIKAELSDLVSRIHEAGENLSVRVSVNFYRDEGDDYVVKYYDFRSDISECLEQISGEHAAGGGDYPEAVHTALENAVTGHRWRNEAVKLCFFVLDAPPHDANDVQGVNESIASSLTEAAKQGIRIIPVASSGVDLETEIILRSFAVVTGGTYVFITNDSGIGAGHKEAEVGDHVVETLNECMIRISCEYCGVYHGEKIPYTQTRNDQQQ